MIHITRPQKVFIGVLVGVLFVLGSLLFIFLSPLSPFSGLHNDLKTVEPPLEQAYTDLDGNPVQFSDFAGEPLVINSWATWMPFSKDELLALIALQESKGESLTVIAINRMEDKSVIRAFLATFGIDANKIIFLVDPADTFYKAIGGYAMPETVFYAKNGTTVHHTRGVLAPEELQTNADMVIGE